jgi:(p)ppGpp synthase/HD superfamily hydrolase
MSTLERAIQIAAAAHVGQVDKAGAPYILHPLRVMMQLEEERERIVGVLHDVIEDTPISIEALRAEGFSDEVLSALECLTKRPGEEYTAFIARAGSSSLSRRVKLADLRDNANLERLASPTREDRARAEKYVVAIRQLLAQT